MTRVSSQILDEFDRPVQGAQVYVLKIDGTQATLTLDGGGPLLQPVDTDTFGSYYYNTADAIYRREIWYGGKKRWVEQLIDTPLDATLRTDLSASTGSSLVNWIGSLTGAVSRLVRDKLRDIVSVPDFSSHAVADAAGATLYVPADVTSTRANGAAVVSVHWGPGRLTTADGNKRGKCFSNVTAAPSSLGNDNSVETAFNGDLSKVQVAMEHRITGAATLSQPTSGYVYTNEAYPNFLYLYNSSGWNNSTADTTGRTAACAYRVKLYQAGLGDLVAYNFSGLVSGARAGATTFLANPGGCGFNGDLVAANAGVYLNPFETTLHDGGFDVAGVGYVANLDRNIGTGALSCYWAGFRSQSVGAVACDAAFSAAGKYNVGTDYTGTNFGANLCAIALKRGDRIYGNAATTDPNLLKATSLGTDYFVNSSSGWDFYVGGNLVMRAGAVTWQMATATVAGLPAAGTAGRKAFVTDANATTFASIVAGSGTNKVPVYDDGTNWRIG